MRPRLLVRAQKERIAAFALILANPWGLGYHNGAACITEGDVTSRD